MVDTKKVKQNDELKETGYRLTYGDTMVTLEDSNSEADVVGLAHNLSKIGIPVKVEIYEMNEYAVETYTIYERGAENG